LLKGKNFYSQSGNLRQREEIKTKFVSKFIPISINSSYGMSIPLFCCTQKGEWKQFPFNGILCHASNSEARTQLLKFPKVGVRIFVFYAREGLLPNHGYESRTKLIAICKNGV
jgi:hypothetical protein